MRPLEHPPADRPAGAVAERYRRTSPSPQRAIRPASLPRKTRGPSGPRPNGPSPDCPDRPPSRGCCGARHPAEPSRTPNPTDRRAGPFPTGRRPVSRAKRRPCEATASAPPTRSGRCPGRGKGLAKRADQRSMTKQSPLETREPLVISADSAPVKACQSSLETPATDATSHLRTLASHLLTLRESPTDAARVTY